MRIFAHLNCDNMTPKVGMKMKASPEITGLKDWVIGDVIDVEKNPFVGVVISIKTPDGNVFFNQAAYFKEVN